MLVKDILNSAISHNHHIAPLTVGDVLRKPCVSEGDVCCLGKNIIAVVACIVFEIAQTPIRRGKLIGALDEWIASLQACLP